MRSRIPDTLLRIALSLLAVGLTTAVLRLVQPWLSTPTVALLYLLPVGISSALWGLPSGIAAAVAAFLALNFFFLPPFYTLRVLRPQDALELFVFLIVAITISQLLGAAQAGLARARAREREARHLNELTTALLGQADIGSISRTIAERILLTLPGAEVGIILQPDGDLPAARYFLPAQARSRQSRPGISLPIQGMRGLLGEILTLGAARGNPCRSRAAAEYVLPGGRVGDRARPAGGGRYAGRGCWHKATLSSPPCSPRSRMNCGARWQPSRPR